MAKKSRRGTEDNVNNNNNQQPNQQAGFNNQGFGARSPQQNNQGYNNQGFNNNNQGFNNQGFGARNQQQNNRGFNNNQQQNNASESSFETQSDRQGKKSGGSMSKVVILVVVAVAVIGGGALYYMKSNNSQAQAQIQQQKQQEAQVQQQASQTNQQLEKAVMSIKTFNNKSSGFDQTSNMVMSLKGTKVPAGTSFAGNITGGTRFIEYTKGRIMLSPGHMFCYITGKISAGEDNDMQGATPFIQQVPYSIYANIPAQGAELAKVEIDTDESGNSVISWALPSVGITNTVQAIQQKEAQQQMAQQMKQINTRQQANLNVVNNS